MCGHQLSVYINPNHGARIDYTGLFADILIRGRVVPVVRSYFYKVVVSDLWMCIVLDFKDTIRQSLKCIFLAGKESFLTTVWTLLHTSLVVLLHQFLYGIIQIVDRVKCPVSEFGIHTLIDTSYSTFDQSLLGGRMRLARHRNKVIETSHVCEALIQGRFIFIALDNSSFQVVAYYDLWDTSN